MLTKKLILCIIIAPFTLCEITFPCAADETNTLDIGMSLPLSGDLAEYGAAVRNGVQLAQSEDRSGFKAITFIFEDNRYDGKTSVSVFNKLTELNKVALIYNWGEQPLHSIAPLAEKRKVPVFAMSFDESPALSKAYIVRTVNYSAQFAEALMNYISNKGYKKIAMIKTEDPFFNCMIKGLRKYIQHDQSVDELFTFQPGDNDFKTPISRLKQSNYDIVGVYLFPGQVSTFYRQAFNQDYQKPTFGTDIFESRSEINQAQGHMQGAIYPNMQISESFANNYMKMFGNDTQIAYAYNAYVFAKLMRDLTASTRLVKTQSGILSDLINLMRINEGSYPFKYKENKMGGKYMEFPIVIKQIDKNEIKVVPLSN